jgi:8-oxo-dGTP diphosphatase
MNKQLDKYLDARLGIPKEFLSKKITEYVLGFSFSLDERGVILILKRNPEWQAGKFNGVGGHVESGETPLEAMNREWREETYMPELPWTKFALLEGDDWLVHCYRTNTDTYYNLVSDLKQFEVSKLPTNIISNTTWLIEMAKAAHSHDWPYHIKEKYNLQNN